MHAPKSNRDTYIDKARNIFILFQNMVLKILNSKVIDSMVLRTCYIYIYIRWKLNQTVLELDCWAVIFFPSLDGIWTHTIDTLQHQSISLMSSALDHSTTSAPYKL
jgi:hypothetical protein